MAYFNQYYIAKGIFPNTMGYLLARLQKKRETSDYDDFYIASIEEAQEQIEAAYNRLKEVKSYLQDKNLFEEIKE